MLSFYNLKFRIIFTIGLLFLLALVFDFFYILPTIKKHDFESVQSMQSGFASQISSSLDFSFSQAVAEIKELARHPSMVSMEKERMDSTLADFNKVTQFFNYYFVLDTNGRWVSYPGRPDMVGKYIPDKNMGWVKRTFDEDGTVFLDVVKTLVGTLVSGFSTPIYSEDGKQVGLLRGVIVTTQENTILSTILDSKVGERGYAYIVSANGWLIAHPKVKQTTSEFTVYDYSSYAPVAAVMKGQEGFVEYEYDGELWLAAYHPIKSTGWGVVVQQPKTDVMKSVNEESYLYVFAALAIALLAVVTLPFVLVYALQPLSRLVDTIKRRNFPVQDTFSHDEIGQLAAEFSTLYSDLIESEQNLKRLNEELEERVNERTVHLMEAREEIQKKEAHYRSVFQHSNDGIIIHDREGVIKDANYRAIELFGYARDEVLSLTIDLLFSPPASDGFTQELERALNEKHIIFESELLKKDGTVFSGDVSLSVLQLEGEHVIQLQVRDVTERIRLEEQLRHSQKMEAVGTLTAGVAHEFNNIMTSILGFGEFLQDDLPTENRLREYADKIVYSAKRAARLTESLMAYSRKQITRFVPVDMNDLLCSVKDFLFGLVGENIELNVEPSVEPLPVLADPNQIEQSILNLVANARDAMPEGGSLTITARKFNPNEDESDEQYAVLDPIPYILISVSDTGMGIAHEIQEKLFEPFFTTKEVGKGTGLGLSMVYGIVRRHNGHIVVKSEPGDGTSFLVFLPLHEEHTSQTSPDTVTGHSLESNTTHGETHKSNASVLLAEDDDAVRDMITNILENKGYTVKSSSNGREALKTFMEHSDAFDLLLFDVAMPQLDGKDAYDEICSKVDNSPKVLFMSGYVTGNTMRQEILDAGHLLITKPFSPKELLMSIREALDPSD